LKIFSDSSNCRGKSASFLGRAIQSCAHSRAQDDLIAEQLFAAINRSAGLPTETVNGEKGVPWDFDGSPAHACALEEMRTQGVFPPRLKNFTYIQLGIR
jgi:hypothetical protein